MDKSFSCALVLLAAGGSRRMGRPKQLLPIGHRPLLRHVVETSIGPLVAPVIVVLGAGATEILPCLNGLPVHVVVNEGWMEGIGASVRVGIKTLVAYAPETMGVIIALADQPKFSSEHISRLLEVRRQTGRSIVAVQSRGKLMPPVFFAAEYFPSLLALRGDSGARSLLQTHAAHVAVLPVEELDDLDTPNDYTKYLNKNKASPLPAP